MHAGAAGPAQPGHADAVAGGDASRFFEEELPQHLLDALARMRAQGVHMATSVDPDGTPRGVLFLEDAIEVLVGEIHDATTAGA